jgi:hypothetical protein
MRKEAHIAVATVRNAYFFREILRRRESSAALLAAGSVTTGRQITGVLGSDDQAQHIT